MSPRRERFFIWVGRFGLQHPYLFVVILALLVFLSMAGGFSLGRELIHL